MTEDTANRQKAEQSGISSISGIHYTCLIITVLKLATVVRKYIENMKGTGQLLDLLSADGSQEIEPTKAAAGHQVLFMPPKLSKGKRDIAKETKIQGAVQGIRYGKYKDPNDAARQLGIWSQKDTIRRRKNNTALPRKISHSSQQLLSHTQEEVLVNWAHSLHLLLILFQRKASGQRQRSCVARSPHALGSEAFWAVTPTFSLHVRTFSIQSAPSVSTSPQ